MTGPKGNLKSGQRLLAVMGIAAVISLTALGCTGADKAPTATTGPSQAPIATEQGKGMPVPPGGTLPPPTGAPVPVEGIPQKGEGVAVGGFVGGPGASVGSGFASVPAVMPGIPVRSPAFGFNAQESQNPTGLWVTGTGEINVKPDLAILSVGVESRSKTVTDARDQAASAMQKIVDAIKSKGVAPDDIATRYFSIQPEYRWIEVRNPDGSYGKQELVGYIVTNQAQAKIRKIDDVGPVIDAAAVAGGDLVRINSVQFTVDDTVKFAGQMRELAAKDALAKAKIYADALGVKVGGVMYLAETSSAAPVYQKDLAYARGAVAEASVPTPISPDTMKLTTSIQVAFTIVP
ncbi:MAG: SIMPL domain-containing protein [Chloroflexi bacterium]|nr:SIMPL domain-containing protein [Chloroflexota bacterium]